MRRVVPFVLAAIVSGCGGQVASETFSEVAETLPTESATPSPETTPSPTPDEREAYQDAVCDVIDPLIMAAGEQMGPALDALANDDAQAAARERAHLNVLVGDVRAVLETGPDYAAARTFETRLAASLDAFLAGLEAFEEGSRNSDTTAIQEAAGLFEVSGELFAEATAEFGVVCR